MRHRHGITSIPSAYGRHAPALRRGVANALLVWSLAASAGRVAGDAADSNESSICKPEGFAAKWGDLFHGIKSHAAYYVHYFQERKNLGLRLETLEEAAVAGHEFRLRQTSSEHRLRILLSPLILDAVDCIACCCCCGGHWEPETISCAYSILTLRLWVLSQWAPWDLDPPFQPSQMGSFWKMIWIPIAEWWRLMRFNPWSEIIQYDFPIFTLLSYVYSAAPAWYWPRLIPVLQHVGADALVVDPQPSNDNDMVVAVNCDDLHPGQTDNLLVAKALLVQAEELRVTSEAMSMTARAKSYLQEAQFRVIAALEADAAVSACTADIWEAADRLACHAWVSVGPHQRDEVHLPAEASSVRFDVRVFHHRDYMSDILRAARSFHCAHDFQLELMGLASQLPAMHTLVDAGITKMLSVVEVGAAFGDCMLWACAALGPRLNKYLAVEMHRDTAGAVAETLAANGLVFAERCPAADLAIANVAAAEREDEEAVAFTPERAAALSHLGPSTNGASGVGMRVVMTTLDLELRRRGVRHVDLLKIHAQGHELRVLRGASKLLASGAVRVVVFANPRELPESEVVMLIAFFRERCFFLEIGGEPLQSDSDALAWIRRGGSGRRKQLVARRRMECVVRADVS